jgi:hypothetical protein
MPLTHRQVNDILRSRGFRPAQFWDCYPDAWEWTGIARSTLAHWLQEQGDRVPLRS